LSIFFKQDGFCNEKEKMKIHLLDKHKIMSSNLPFELIALAEAQKYQRWVYDMIKPYLGNRILEIGAGIGNMSRWMPIRERLILTEYNPQFLKLLKNKIYDSRTDADLSKIRFEQYDILNESPERFCEDDVDTIVSFNVLEHVEDDEKSLSSLLTVLRCSQAPGPKRLINFVPAHNWAYGETDRKFGHFRRYSKRRVVSLVKKLAPEARFFCRHFNFMGLWGWILSGRILRRSSIDKSVIRTFELLNPLARFLDLIAHRFLHLPLGQSLMFVIEL
jgi:SAM-dependent methyltransferase